jgi:hypothetical protein
MSLTFMDDPLVPHFISIFGYKRLSFDASIVVGELPADAGLGGVAAFGPGFSLAT